MILVAMAPNVRVYFFLIYTKPKAHNVAETEQHGFCNEKIFSLLNDVLLFFCEIHFFHLNSQASTTEIKSRQQNLNGT